VGAGIWKISNYHWKLYMGAGEGGCGGEGRAFGDHYEREGMEYYRKYFVAK
jgi:hypothetical protein